MVLNGGLQICSDWFGESRGKMLNKLFNYAELGYKYLVDIKGYKGGNVDLEHKFLF